MNNIENTVPTDCKKIWTKPEITVLDIESGTVAGPEGLMTPSGAFVGVDS